VSPPDAWQRADGGDARGFASRLSEGLVHQIRQFASRRPSVARSSVQEAESTLLLLCQNLMVMVRRRECAFSGRSFASAGEP
jgi:hypothetical protein